MKNTEAEGGNYIRNEKYKRINQKTNIEGIEEERKIK